jgi:Arc/MetJ-type ribon-helix-helix transcriptional regulator
MATLKISLPDDLNAFVESEVASGGYPNVDRFFHDIVEQHRRYREDQALQQQMLLDIARRKGDVTQEDHERVRREVRERRLAELRHEIQLGIDQLDNGEWVEYESVDDCVEDIMTEGRKLLEQRRARQA